MEHKNLVSHDTNHTSQFTNFHVWNSLAPTGTALSRTRLADKCVAMAMLKEVKQAYNSPLSYLVKDLTS